MDLNQVEECCPCCEKSTTNALWIDYQSTYLEYAYSEKICTYCGHQLDSQGGQLNWLGWSFTALSSVLCLSLLLLY